MSTKKMVKSPFKRSVQIIGGILILLCLIKFTPDMHNSIRQRKQNKKIRALQVVAQEAKIIQARKEKAAEPKPIPEVIEFILRPGESISIPTNGDKFDYRFYGNTYFDVYRGKYASERIEFRNASYENRVEYKDMAEISLLKVSRPIECKTPLGYMITVYRKP